MQSPPSDSTSFQDQPLVLILADRSGSMLYDGKIQALNAAIEELLPHLRDRLCKIEIVGFALDATVHQTFTPGHFEPLVSLAAVKQGPTETGRSISTACESIRRHLGPVAVVLLTDGRPTDLLEPTFAQALDELQSCGSGITRLAMGIGRDIDLETLNAFVNGSTGHVCNDPMEIVGRLHAATKPTSEGRS